MARKIFQQLGKQAFNKKKWTNNSMKYGKVFAFRAKKGIDKGLKNMGNEAVETKDMAKSFFKLLEHKLNLNDRTVPPTEEEVKIAIEQLKDVGRLSVFTTAVILPGGAVSLMGLEILARKFGIKFTFIPSSFRKNAEWKYPGGKNRQTRSSDKWNEGNIETIKPVDE
ncbi:MAG: hypothetical protein PF450_05190 [Bacteroidales bacterium]|jgi:hypothetical protein|nr:hypothetical protein [Bacteroidales bacterium]